MAISIQCTDPTAGPGSVRRSQVSQAERARLNQKLFEILESKNPQVDDINELIENGAEVNARDDDSWTPLSRASMNGHTEVASLLIGKGADVDARDDDGLTPLMWASRSGQTKVAELLKRHGAKE